MKLLLLTGVISIGLDDCDKQSLIFFFFGFEVTSADLIFIRANLSEKIGIRLF